jgi:lycopene cyclase CruP
MFKDMEKFHTEQSGGAGGGTTFDDLKNIDKVWERLRNPVATAAIPEVVTTSSAALWMAPEYDVVVSGGTLGVFLAAALQLRGLSTAVLERGKLRGRSQEWNISRSEMESLVKLGILSEDELEEVINAEFNPVRVGFKVRTPMHAID